MAWRPPPGCLHLLLLFSLSPPPPCCLQALLGQTRLPAGDEMKAQPCHGRLSSVSQGYTAATKASQGQQEQREPPRSPSPPRTAAQGHQPSSITSQSPSPSLPSPPPPPPSRFVTHGGRRTERPPAPASSPQPPEPLRSSAARLPIPIRGAVRGCGGTWACGAPQRCPRHLHLPPSNPASPRLWTAASILRCPGFLGKEPGGFCLPRRPLPTRSSSA